MIKLDITVDMDHGWIETTNRNTQKGSSKVQILGKVSGRGSDSCCIIGMFFLWNGEEDAGIGQGQGKKRREKDGKGETRKEQKRKGGS